MRVAALSLLLLCSVLVGCTSFHAVETTPEGIIRTVEPGDVVRLTTRDRGTFSLLVWAVGHEDLRGRTRGDESEVVRIRYDRIEVVEIERLNLRKTMLATLVPVVLGAAVVCGRQDCHTGGVIVSSPQKRH